jgi:glycosyltransferase involved in cell wall biosynthesis
VASTIIFTSAYNAEKTLRRTIDSVIAQTRRDFVYYIVDNGSADNTRQIIQEYADKDDRIQPVYHEKNNLRVLLEFLPVMFDCRAEEYFTIVDADDTLKPEYLEQLLSFTKQNSLEIVACGSLQVDARTGELIPGGYRIEQNLVLNGDSYSRFFGAYSQFMYTTWGKLYKVTALRRMKLAQYPSIFYGGDTLFATEAFRVAKRIGVLAEPLHRYYISYKSVSYTYDSTRKIATWLAVDVFEKFLTEKTGGVSPENREILLGMYLNNVQRAVQNIANAQVSIQQKLTDFCDMLTHQRTAELMESPIYQNEKNEVFVRTINWVIQNPETKTHEKFMFLASLIDIFAPLGAGDAITEILANEPMLSDLTPKAAAFMSSAVSAVLQQDFNTALEALLEQVDSDIPDEYTEAFLNLGLNLSAKLENAGAYMYFKKLQISALIDLSRFDDACKALADWDKTVPDDADFKAFRAMLTQSGRE